MTPRESEAMHDEHLDDKNRANSCTCDPPVH